MLYDLVGTINAGIEYKVSNNISTDFSLSINPWNYGSWEIKHLLFQPEIRYWLEHTYNHVFLGSHLIAGNYNFSGLRLPFGIYDSYELDVYKYEGVFCGIGMSIGSQWYFNKSWGMEVSLGLGYTYWIYNKFHMDKDNTFLERQHSGLFSLTKIGLSLVYKIND